MAIIESPESSSQSLPKEIVIEILLKLPVESLLRCKSVCKLWFSFISDPHFVDSHLSLSAHNKILIFSLEYGSVLSTFCLNDELMAGNFINNALEVVDYPLKSANRSFRFVGSCSGLLCLRISSKTDPHDDILVLWNPSTRKYHKLPSYAYTTNVSWKLFGFGYDNSSDDYKVVSIFTERNEKGRSKMFVKMQSLKNGSWKDVGAFPHGRPSGFGTFVNGALHWAVQNSDYLCKIISLDLATESFGEVMLPVFDEGEMDLSLGSLREWLCVVCDYDQIRVDLWAMKAYGVKDSWTKVLSLPYMADQQTIYDLLMPLCISDNGRILLTLGKKLMIYDSKNNSFSDVQNFDDWVLAFTFVESLVSPRLPAAAPGHGVAGS